MSTVHVGLEAMDRLIVDAPQIAGELHVAVRREFEPQAGQRRMLAIAIDQFAHDGQHGSLDALIERIVVGRQTMVRDLAIGPSKAFGSDQLDAVARRSAGSQQCFELR